MSDLTSAAAPSLRDDDHVRGPEDGPLVVVYADLACPHCAVAHERLRAAGVRVCLRHFALRTRHPRALPLALASEAAAAQDAFWPFVDAVYADQGRIDDPHLWAKAGELGLDVDRFDAARRSDTAAQRVARDVQDGLRAGVAQTPTLIVEGVLHGGVPTAEWLARLH
ncbi:MAG: DsbA family protein [Baekduiaceae bacterium]